MIPVELCTVTPGQIMRKQIPPDKTTDVVEFSKMTPNDRLANIRTGLNVGEIVITVLGFSYDSFRSSNMDKANMFELLA